MGNGRNVEERREAKGSWKRMKKSKEKERRKRKKRERGKRRKLKRTWDVRVKDLTMEEKRNTWRM